MHNWVAFKGMIDWHQATRLSVCGEALRFHSWDERPSVSYLFSWDVRATYRVPCVPFRALFPCFDTRYKKAFVFIVRIIAV